MERTDHKPHQPSPRTTEQTTGFRIMRETEIAPGWFSTAREIGDTRSATVADTFCREQNKVTMDPNRTKRIQYYAEPIVLDDRRPTCEKTFEDCTCTAAARTPARLVTA